MRKKSVDNLTSWLILVKIPRIETCGDKKKFGDEFHSSRDLVWRDGEMAMETAIETGMAALAPVCHVKSEARGKDSSDFFPDSRRFAIS